MPRTASPVLQCEKPPVGDPNRETQLFETPLESQDASNNCCHAVRGSLAHHSWLASPAASRLNGQQTERKNALEDFNEVFADAADIVAGLFRLAGHGQMARGFKPSRQHKGRTLADVKRLEKRRARKRGREEAKVEVLEGAREEGSRNAEALDGVREAGGETPLAPTAAGSGGAPRSRSSRRPRAWLRFASRRRGRSFRDLPVSGFDSRGQNDSATSQGLLHRVFLRLARPKGRL